MSSHHLHAFFDITFSPSPPKPKRKWEREWHAHQYKCKKGYNFLKVLGASLDSVAALIFSHLNFHPSSQRKLVLIKGVGWPQTYFKESLHIQTYIMWRERERKWMNGRRIIKKIFFLHFSVLNDFFFFFTRSFSLFMLWKVKNFHEKIEHSFSLSFFTWIPKIKSTHFHFTYEKKISYKKFYRRRMMSLNAMIEVILWNNFLSIIFTRNEGVLCIRVIYDFIR